MLHWLLLAALAVPVHASATGTAPSTTPGQGAAIEAAPEGSAGEKAGLRPGDIVVAWRRAANPPATPNPASGQIRSPFDLARVQVEQMPRGAVTLTGRRGSTMRRWSMPSEPWGVTLLPSLSPNVRSAHDQGVALLAAGKPDQALDAWRAAARRVDDPTGAWLLLASAKALAAAEAVTQADSAFAEALGRSVSGSWFARYWINREWGEVHRARSEWEPALERYRLARESVASSAPGGLGEAWLDAAAGWIDWSRGRFQTAEEHLQRSLAIREKLAPSTLYVASSLEHLGSLAKDRGDLSAADDYYRRSLAIREKLAPDSSYVADSLHNLGNVAKQRGDLASAERYYRRSLEIREKRAPDSPDVAGSLNGLGDLAWTRGDLATAEELLRRSLALIERLLPDGLEVAACLNNLGNVTSERGALDTAEEYYRRSLAIREKHAPGTIDVAGSLTNLGGNAWYRGDLAAAEDFFRRALAIAEAQAPESILVAKELSNLGSIAKDRGEFAAAEDYLRRGLAICQKLAPDGVDAATDLLNLGEVAYERGELASADDLCRQSAAIRETLAPASLLVAESLECLGAVAQARGDLAGAQDDYARALGIRERLAPGSKMEAESLHALGETHRLRGKPDLATEYLCKAVDALERQKRTLGGAEEAKALFGAGFARYYTDCAAALVEQNQQAAALSILERSRARSFLTMLAERDLLLTADVPAELRQEGSRTDAEYDRTQAALASLNPGSDGERIEQLLGRLRELRAKQEDVAARIKKASPRFGSLKYSAPLDLAGVRSTLDGGTVFLGYSVGENETLLFVVTPQGPAPGLTVHKLAITAQALRAKVQALRTLIARADQDGPNLDSLGGELYDLLLKPAEKAIEGSERVLVSPDGPLHTLPFSALRRRVEQKAVEYVAEWKPVHAVVSATVYAELKRGRRDRDASPMQLVAFGDPTALAWDGAGMDAIPNAALRSVVRAGFAFAPLPASRTEVHEIESLFPNRARVYVGAEATEQKAKTATGDARYLHFATHGYVNERFPLDSALVLSIPEKLAEGQDNGLLQAWEVLEKVRIDADLVTLSACETGLGKEVGGEGLVGLTRSFQYAGARSVLASLWAVSDESTAALMKGFYRRLQAGQSKDEALRAAQVEMIQSSSGNAHPFHWAAFEMIGDWK